MVEKLSSYRVTAALDATAYAAGMAQKVAADKAGAASAGQVGAAVTATQTKVSQAGDVLTRLSRSYVDGFSNAERFSRAVNTLGRGIETGNVPMAQADRILDGIYRKFGMTANAADLLEQGHYQLATAVTALNAKLAAEDAVLDSNTVAHQRNTAALRMANMQRTNLMFQLQDIGVSLASGMNPLMVAMQQGTQISMIYGAGEGGLGRALQETGKIATGLVTKLWPVAAVLGALTLGTAALTTEINRSQRQQVGFGDVLVAMWELASESILDALQPIADWFGDMWGAVSPAIAYGMNALIGTFDLAFRDVKSTWSMLPQALGDFTIKTANNVIGAMEDMINGAIDLLNGFIVEADKLLPDNMKLGEVGKVDFGPGFDNPFTGAEARYQAQKAKDAAEVAALVASGGYIGMIGARAGEVATRLSESEAKKAADAAAKEAERQRKAYADLVTSSQQFIADKQLEAQTLGMTTEAAARLRYEQEMLNKATNDNIALSPDQVSELNSLAAAMAAAEEATRKAKEAFDFAKDATKGFLQDLRQGLMDGQSFWQSFGDAALSVLDKIISKIEDNLVDALFSLGGTGGGGGDLFGFIGSILGFANGGVFNGGMQVEAFARGGVIDRPTIFPFSKGIGLMGEAGPEAIMPLQRGPDGRLGVSAANQNTVQRIHVTVGVDVDDSGNILPFVKSVSQETVGQAAPGIVAAAVGQSNRSAPAAVAKYQQQRAGGDYRI